MKMMKKSLKAGLCMLNLLLCMILFNHTVLAASGGTSLSVSSSNVNIGDTVTVTAKATGASGEKAVATMTLSYDASILQFESCTATYGGGGGSVVTTTDSFTVTFKAISAGTSSVSLSATDGVTFDTTEELDSMSGSGTSVTVNNAAGSAGTDNSTSTGNTTSTTGNTGNTGNTGTNSNSTDSSTSGGTLSADNSLKSLSISPGTLSPSFSRNTTKYTATVENTVTSIAVSAVATNEKASVTEVTGNNNLSVGSNTIKIVVKAENGVTATYTITVTRQAEANTSANASNIEETDPEEATEEETEQEAGVSVDGVAYRIWEDFSEEEIPEDFVEVTVTYQDAAYRGVSFLKGSLQMLYLLSDSETEQQGGFFIYDEARGNWYPFVKLSNGSRYVIALLPPSEYTISDSYVQTNLSVDGQGTITAYQLVQEDAELASDFYLFYGVNSDGTEGWYCYDAYENTYQRCQSDIFEDEDETDEDIQYLQEQYTELSEKYTESRKNARTVIAILIFLLAVSVIVIINLLLQRFHKWDEEGIDEETDELNQANEEELLEKITLPEDWDEERQEEDDLSDDVEDAEEAEGAEEEEAGEMSGDGEDAKEQADNSFEVIDFNDL
jgi:hypothetical protein